MMPSKFIIFVVIMTACTFNPVQAAFPDVSESDFNGHQGVFQVNSDDNKKYLAILAKKKILIDKIQYKKQKKLSLKSKKILLNYFRQIHGREVNIRLHHLSPVKYWEKDNFSYLISIINEANVGFISRIKKEAKQSHNNVNVNVVKRLSAEKKDEN